MAPASEADWVSLVRSIAAGDQHALQLLYQSTHRVVFSLIMRISNNRETAEELTVDVFHGVWRRAARFDAASGSVFGWIVNQARSRAIDRLRFEQRKKRVNPHPVGSAAAAAAAAGDDCLDGNGCDELLDQLQRDRQLRRALAVLTPEERQAIETAFFSELTYVEAADRLHQPVGTVKTRIRSGLEKLRQVLAREAPHR